MVKAMIVPMFFIFVTSLGVIAIGLVYKVGREALQGNVLLRWPRVAGLAKGVCYHHPGHTWAKTVKAGIASVGLDELGVRVIGAIDGIRLPKVGQNVQQGRAAWRLYHKGRTVDLVSPVTGRVVEVNEELRHDPGLVNRSPYGQGWMFKIQVRRIREDLKNLFTGALARRLNDASKAWICYSFSLKTPELSSSLVYQDGGELVEGLGDSLDDESWEKLKSKIFLA